MRDLIRERQLREEAAASEIEVIRFKLLKAEQSDFANQHPQELLSEIKSGLGRNKML